ncbi:MAG: hypothetical protein ICV63_05925 [Coleofasciculus sp. Co-bin14]|nr:hypothetical protein [Coleofasciculus sp. Co-bin14]
MKVETYPSGTSLRWKSKVGYSSELGMICPVIHYASSLGKNATNRAALSG